MRLILAGLFSLALAAAPPASKDCIACHDTVDLAKFGTTLHGGLACTDCHGDIRALPHGDKHAPVNCATCHAEEVSAHGASVHGQSTGKGAPPLASCATCHGSAHKLAPHPGKAAPVNCGSCHESEVKVYARSVHGKARKNGMADAATCVSCHGSSHGIRPKTDPTSKVAKQNLADTCGTCHSNPEFLAQHKIPYAKPVEAYRLSVHGRAVTRGNLAAASCSDCHGSHGILASSDPAAGVNHINVLDTCGVCHGGVKTAFNDSVHGQALKHGSKGVPTCTDCHGEHSILGPTDPGSLVNPTRVSTVTCGRCHGDERLTTRYDLGSTRVSDFQDSFHGLAMRGGQKTVANCASCHGVHNILSSSDTRSTVNPKNLGQTCGKCHPGAGEKLAAGPVHVRSATITEHISVRWIRLAYLVLIPLTIGFMLVHNFLDWLAKLRRGPHHGGTHEGFPRMNLTFRITHFLVIVSFLTLVITGFALKFPEALWVKLFQSFDPTSSLRPVVHRIAALLMMAATVFHIIHLAVSRRDRVMVMELLPSWQDAKDIFNMFRFNLGLIRERPTFGMFGYAEKMEYWAFMWGTVVMAVTGFLLWAENWSLRYFPKWVMDAATAAHWYEAILATLSILVWHWYLVIFDPDVYPMDLAWLNGKASADHIRETRPEYYRKSIEAKGNDPDSQ